MEEKRTIEIKVRLTESERNQLEERSGKSPLAVFIRESALGIQGTPNSNFAGEDNSDGMDFLLRLMKRFKSPDHFVECLCTRLGETLPDRLEVVLKTKPVIEVEGVIQV